MATKKRLVDEVVSLLPTSSRVKWESTLSPDELEELRQLRADWLAGLIRGPDGRQASRNGLAQSLARVFAARGKQVHRHTIVRWLEQV